MRIPLVLAAAIALPLTAAAQGADPNLGRNLASTCAGCHGVSGNALTGMPALTGQSKEALLRTLKDYKEGKRPATVMHQLAKGYSDAQLELVAAYYAAQK
jgi:cytochrome subunit of sulfide dehydrogenase